jgi:hypothetical protein
MYSTSNDGKTQKKQQLLPARIEVRAPSTNAAVVNMPCIQEPWPIEMRKNTMAPKMSTKIRQMLYSASVMSSSASGQALASAVLHVQCTLVLTTGC